MSTVSQGAHITEMCLNHGESVIITDRTDEQNDKKGVVQQWNCPLKGQKKCHEKKNFCSSSGYTWKCSLV